MKPVTLNEIQNLKHAVQYFQDCYLVSSIGALTRSKNGMKILSENIAHSGNDYRIRFKNINGESKDFFVTQKEADELIYMDKFLNPVPINPDCPHNPIIKAIEVAMNKLLQQFPEKKPLICRLAGSNEKFEFNKPSNFLEMFTGKKPIKINESSIRFSLKSKAREAEEIFNKISQEPDSSFVAGTAINFSKNFSNYHCYSIKNVNNKNKTVQIFDHRLLKTFVLTYEEAIKKLKFIVGYFNKDLV